MATFKVKFRPSSENGREGILYYQVIHKRAVRQIPTCYKLFKHEWDNETAEFILPLNEDRTKYLLALKEKVRNDTQLLVNVIKTLDNRLEPYTSDHVIAAYNASKRKDTLFTFMQDTINTLQELGKIRTSETYASTLNSFTRFRGGEDILLEHIDSALMMSYEAWLLRENVCANSRSFYMRILRAVYNRAVEIGTTAQRYPFKHVYTGVEKTTKRSISLRDIRQIKNFDFPPNSKDDLSRNLFLFSFYTRGMSFVDMAFLKKNDLSNGILSYRRRKTGQLLFIHWEKCMQEIVDKYDTNDSPYLLPIIKNVGDDERQQYLSS
ncbi:MAG: site-specific integrase, partial [Bacteroides sp.]|nr:site-specific integrase [Bacteroides sp.]